MPFIAAASGTEVSLADGRFPLKRAKYRAMYLRGRLTSTCKVSSNHH
jgi:hypothetical protein